MTSSVAQELIDKTFRELAEAEKPAARSRISNTHNGYIFLITWSNAHLLRFCVRLFTGSLSRSEHRLKAQLDDAARSVIANIEEGFGRPTTREYLNFLGYSQASLIEVKGDIERSRQDGFLKSVRGSSLAGFRINLADWHEALRKSVISRPVENRGIYGNLGEIKGQNQVPLKSFKFLYSPVDNLRVNDLTYEIFIELINKTDWHLRRLVMSLESKQDRDKVKIAWGQR